MEDSKKFLNLFSEFLSIERTDFKLSKDFKLALKDKGDGLNKLVEGFTDNPTDYRIKELIVEKMNEPIFKIRKLLKEKKIDESKGIFGDPMDEKEGVTPFERYLLLRETAEIIKDNYKTFNNEFELVKARDLFEQSELSKYLETGINDLISSAKKSSNPAIANKMNRELCGLLYTLTPEKSVDRKKFITEKGEFKIDSIPHAISECKKIMPIRMLESLKTQDLYNCSYIDYLNRSVQEDFFKTGKRHVLPK